MLNDSAMHVALMVVEGSTSVEPCGLDLSPTRFGCWAMMATLRREFFAVTARVGLRLAAADAEESPRAASGGGLTSSAAGLLERKGFDVKKCRFRGRLAGVVRWNERRGRRDVTELWICLATTLRVIRCGGYLIMMCAVPCVNGDELGCFEPSTAPSRPATPRRARIEEEMSTRHGSSLLD
jgi:hypothetical protein